MADNNDTHTDLPPSYNPEDEEKVALLHTVDVDEKDLLQGTLTEVSPLPAPATTETATATNTATRRRAARWLRALPCLLFILLLIGPLLCGFSDGDDNADDFESHHHHHKHHSHALKKHHKHPKKGHKGKCRGTSISQNLPKGYEPSDLVWDKPSSTLYIASDNGRIAGVDVDGKIKQEYNLGETFDLEGIALVPWRRDVIYLGHEAPPAILEFNLTSSKITQRWNLTAPADADKNKCDVYLKDGKVSTQKANGIESLVFIATRNSPNGGFFYAGRQCDARVFVYDIPIEGGNDGKVLYRGYIDPPGPGYDLAAMTAYNEILYLVYDKDKVVHALDLTDSTLIPPPLTHTPHPSPPDNSTSPKWIVDATDMDATDYDLTFKRRGQEGMTFAEVRGTQHETFVFLGIDPPGKKGKGVIRYEVGEFWECFEEKKGKGKKGKGKKEKWWKKWGQVEEEGEGGQGEEEKVEVDGELKKVGEDVQKKIGRGDDYIVKGKPW